MASERTIASVLAYMHELYPTREVSATTAQAWSMAFSDWTDEDLQAAARKAATTAGRTFFPTPGEIAACRDLPRIDAGRILRRISALGRYNPNGWLYPSLETIRESLGDGVAQAYAAAGAERCFADDESISQDIARRTFAAELTATQKANPESLRLAAPAVTLALPSGEVA